jgi:hydroxymethylbilane synthase
MKILRIGTRKSQLALWQANYVRDALLGMHSNISVELVGIVSEGDKTLDIPLSQVGGKGLFLKELEMALLEGEIDLAVHSMKDVTVNLPKGLHIPVMCARDDPRDAFVSNLFDSFGEMPKGSVVGTCSLRRQCQIRALYPHLKLKNLRGNVNTRLAKLDDGEYDAIILAAAGLKRLELDQRITGFIEPSDCLPAAGQGIIGIECRIDDEAVNQLINPLNNLEATIQIRAERSANEQLGGGCHVPVAIFSELSQHGFPESLVSRVELQIRALVGHIDGSVMLRSEKRGSAAEPEKLGIEIANDLNKQGAGEILAAVYENR